MAKLNRESKLRERRAEKQARKAARKQAGAEPVQRDEVTVDPGGLPEDELARRGIRRLPTSLEEAVGHLEKSEVLREAMGPMLFGPFLAVRRAEAEAFKDEETDEIVAAHRWRY